MSFIFDLFFIGIFTPGINLLCFNELSSTEQMIYGDNDQTTWEKVDTGFAIPDGTEYLVVSLKAKKHGPSALTANKHDFFADELEISFAGI